MRYRLICVLAILVGGCAAAYLQLTRESLIEAGHKAKHRSRRIIMSSSKDQCWVKSIREVTL